MNPRDTRGPEPRSEAHQAAATGEPDVTDRRQFLLRLARTTAFVAPALYSVSIGALPAAAVSSPRYKVCDWNANPEKCMKGTSAPANPDTDRRPGSPPPVWERDAAPAHRRPDATPPGSGLDRPL